MIASALALPGSVFFLIASGLLFGVFPGLFYAAVGATAGAALLFLLSRYLIGTWVQKKYALQLAKFNSRMERYGSYYLFIIRLAALLPFFLVNLLSGITLIPFGTFVIITFLGVLPGALIFGFAGQALGSVDSVEVFFAPPIIVAFVVLIVVKLFLFPFLYFHIKKEYKKA